MIVFTLAAFFFSKLTVSQFLLIGKLLCTKFCRVNFSFQHQPPSPPPFPTESPRWTRINSQFTHVLILQTRKCSALSSWEPWQSIFYRLLLRWPFCAVTVHCGMIRTYWNLSSALYISDIYISFIPTQHSLVMPSSFTHKSVFPENSDRKSLSFNPPLDVGSYGNSLLIWGIFAIQYLPNKVEN